MDMMSTILMIEGTMGGCAAFAAFRYQRRMDREVAAGRGTRWSHHFSAATEAGGAAGMGAQRGAGRPSTGLSSRDMTTAQACACLRVSSAARPDELRRAYHAQCMRWHPDRFAMADAGERGAAARAMTRINAAYSLLAPRPQ